MLRKTLGLLWCGALAIGQQSSSLKNEQDTPPPTFRAKANLVLVPVVVRRRHGGAVGDLTQRDFQLFDNGKRQSISTFSAITRGSSAMNNNTVAGSATRQHGALGSTRVARNFIYVFDDLNIRFSDLARVRLAAVEYFKNAFSDGDRAAIYTLTGRNSVEFTSDREKLEAAVLKLQWGTVAGHGGMECPDVSYYIADLVIAKADSQALEALTSHTAECAHVRPEIARQIAMSAAYRESMLGRDGTKLTLSALQRAVRRLSGMPGERVIVLASPGFFAQTPEASRATAELLELAARNDVIINGLSVRGVIVAEEEEDVARRVIVRRQAPPRASSPDQLWIRYRQESARADADEMKDLSEGTGGILFQNNNDLRAGFERLAAVPEFSYVLGFSPDEFKGDGSFHHLKVRLLDRKGATVEARHGYYAFAPDAQPRQRTTELADAVFSHDERSEIPIVLQTGYWKPNQADVVKVQVLARIGVSSLRFEKVAGRNDDSVQVVVALFEPDGTYVTDKAEIERLSLDDATLRKKDPAITLRWDFPGIKPGDYVVRFVVHEPKTGATTIINRTMKIL